MRNSTLLAAACFSIFIACKNPSTVATTDPANPIAVDTTRQGTTTDVATTTPATPALQQASVNNSLDNAVDYIACMSQPADGAYKALEADSMWTAQKRNFDKTWATATGKRFAAMNKWQKEEFTPKIQPAQTLFYPFSGPDYLHAYHLYPQATRIVMLGLEPVGKLPNLNEYKKDGKLNSYMNYLNNSLSDIFNHSFFHTNHMREQLKDEYAKGITPLLLFFMKRTGHKIATIEHFILNANGRVVNDGNYIVDKPQGNEVFGVDITFLDKNNVTKKLTYYSANVHDKDMPDFFLKELQKLKNTNTFLKSASYLMHKPYFSKMRNLILENSQSIFQDDTGISFNYYEKNKWKFQLYGQYTTPIALFANLYQPDLDTYWKQDSSKKQLPFNLGYHLSGPQNYMLSIKK